VSFDKFKALEIKNKVEKLGGHLVAVSKKFKIEVIKQAAAAGIEDFGENYVEEALEKIASYSSSHTKNENPVRWHFIGNVQSNNINKMIDKFDVVHSLFKLKHIKKFNENSSTRQKILIQVRHEDDSRENGVFLNDLESLILKVKPLPMINLKGLMFMPPEEFTKEELSQSFKRIKETFDSLSCKDEKNDWDMISMGMSADFEIALEMGATHVRIGTAVFGART